MDATDRAQANLDRAMERFEQRQQVRPSPARLEPTCHDCSDLIPLARLQAEPTATRCIVCQTRHELTYRM